MNWEYFGNAVFVAWLLLSAIGTYVYFRNDNRRRKAKLSFKARVVDGLRRWRFSLNYCTCSDHVTPGWCVYLSNDHYLMQDEPDACMRLLGDIVLAAADPSNAQWGSVWHEWRVCPTGKTSFYHILLKSND